MVRGRDNYYHSRVKLVTITGATARAVNTSRFRFSVVPPLPLARRRIDCGFVGQIITIINHHPQSGAHFARVTSVGAFGMLSVIGNHSDRVTHSPDRPSLHPC